MANSGQTEGGDSHHIVAQNGLPADGDAAAQHKVQNTQHQTGQQTFAKSPAQGKYFIEGGNNRVILATDGDFNVGVSSVDGLEKLISQKRDSGVYFSVFGVGRGNLQNNRMEALALKGNGTCSYIDSKNEARRALVEQIGGTMVTVAKDVKAGITFNTDYVESFRLIGYENKLLTQEEFENSETDAGELGSGHTITVALLYMYSYRRNPCGLRL